MGSKNKALISAGEIATQPVFVVGYMHSGTTLLFNILARHSSMYASGGETKFFERQLMIRRAYPDLRNDLTLRRFVCFVIGDITHRFDLDPPRALKAFGVSAECFEAMWAEAKQERDCGAVFRIVFDRLARQQGKTHWLEKTPTHVFHIDEIIRSIPDARFIEIVRDPRDVLASKKTRRATVWTTDRYTPEQRLNKHLEKAYDPIWDTLSWKSAIRAGLAARRTNAEQIFTIRYEDLVTDPERRIREMGDFLAVPCEPDMLDISYRNAAEEITSKGAGIKADSVRWWRRVLTPGEVATCQWVAKTEMSRHGYERVPVKLADRVKLPYFMGRGTGEFVVRLSRRWRMGGGAFLAHTLVGYGRRLQKLVRR